MPSTSRLKDLGGELRSLRRHGRQVWRLVPRRYKWSLGGAAIVMAATSLCSTLVPLLLGKLVDSVKRGADQGMSHPDLYRLAAWFLVLIAVAYVFREGLNVLRRYLVENAIARINRDMIVRLVGHMMKVDLGTLNHEKIGALHGRIFRSVDGFVRFLRVNFLDFIPALFTGLFAIVATVTKAPLLGVVMLGVVPTSVYLTVRQLLSQKGVRLKLMRSCDEIDGAVVEQFGGIEYIRASDTHQQELHRLARAAEKRRIKETRHHVQMSLFGCAKALNEGLFHVIVLAMALYLAIDNRLTFGEVLTFSILFLNVMAPLSEVHRVLDEGHEAGLRVADLLEMLGKPVDPSFAPAPPPKQPDPALIPTPLIARGVILPPGPRLVPGEPVVTAADLRVEFATDLGKRVVALDGVSLTIRHGETIGVAGRSGGGKSTWIKVLLRLIHPCGGRVMLGDMPIESVSRAELARLIGYVGQSPFVFSGTIAENIAYGNERITADDIRRAAEMANIHDEIMEMPGGYNAVVTERGQNLSGGQRQRLAIARILLHRAPILILDEATSALDNISERHVQRSLGFVEHNCTTILVAHRLSTLRDADRIFVFDDGKIAEVGTYDELVKRDGVFAELVHSAEHGLTTESPQVAVAAS